MLYKAGKKYMILMNCTSPYLQMHFNIILLFAFLSVTCLVWQEGSPPEFSWVFIFSDAAFNSTYLLTPCTLLHGASKYTRWRSIYRKWRDIVFNTNISETVRLHHARLLCLDCQLFLRPQQKSLFLLNNIRYEIL